MWVCPHHKSPPLDVRLSKFGTKMYVSTVKVPNDLGIDWPWCSVSFLISNLLFFFTKLCISYSLALFCTYLVRPSPVSVPHPTWLHTHTDSYAWTMTQGNFTTWWDHWSSASLDSAIGTGFYKLLSVFAILYMLRMSKVYMPTLINHHKSSITAPISLNFVRFLAWGSLHQCYFSAVGKHLRQYRIPVCSTS